MMPQPPQFVASVGIATQAPPQSVRPWEAQSATGAWTAMQTPALHESPCGQRRAQPPQLFGSLATSTQTPPQSVKPCEVQSAVCESAAGEQKPPPHASPAPQTAPQAPQFATSVMMSTQIPLQSVRPCPAQSVVDATQALLLHNSPSAQATPQAPQFAVFEVRSTQTPLQS